MDDQARMTRSMAILAKGGYRDETPKTDNLAEMMAEAAEVDLGAPFSLIQDAWDNVESSLLPDEKFTPTQMRAIFKVCLKEAARTFHADQINYRFNDKAL